MLFGQFVKAGEVERALDVARHSLAVGTGGSKLLTKAQEFAERAGLHKLADEVAALPRVTPAGAAATPAPAPAAAAAPREALRPARQELPARGGMSENISVVTPSPPESTTCSSASTGRSQVIISLLIIMTAALVFRSTSPIGWRAAVLYWQAQE